ncbi:snRNA-activating protein complex subunit isoform X3 [Hordeum vulgare subsp. vulgare]|uniref:snRNA-activating protein complex subunit isoform X3 n=1 Tax=Hordeum vulgare subsp. vulgare TaxID=112509 RepID=UPI001D1A4A1E|nr:snRNA-activating protein complex subunit isoform X3 [Hordeum vulgare subsp. vulgare]
MPAAGEDAESSAAAEERPREPFARGGPVFIPFMVGPVCTVPEFISSTLREVQSLRDELGDPGDEFEDELCIDELRVLSEEELVERALREAMEEGWDSGAPSQSVDQSSAAPSPPLDQSSGTPSQPFDQSTCRMSASSTPGNETVTSSASAETQSSVSPPGDMAIELHKPQGSNGKTRGVKRKTRERNGNNGALTSDSTAERDTSGSRVELAIVPHESEGSKRKPNDRKGKNGTSSTSSIESETPVLPSEDMSVVPHDLEGTDGQTQCKKGKKRGRHFDREVRAHILQGSYLTKAEKMAEIKVKQEDDKRAARLHSFSGDSVMSKGSKASAEKMDLAKSLKYNSAPWKNKASKSEEHIPIVSPEAILCVEIYEWRHGSVKNQEFLVLGSQLLTDLKDNIYCSTNKLMELNKLHNHSGYFLIEDTFYNDTRHYSAVDYSRPILDWLDNSSDEVAEKWDAISSGVLKKRQKDLLKGLNISNVPEFKSANMQSTYFSDLHFRLGAGYLYCHQGNCKHTFVIRDMRLIHPEDTQNQAEYPLMTFHMQRRFQKCSVCQIYLATKMTVDDKWAPNNPCYFCKQCYYLLHYKEDDSLLYHHTVYDYFQE